MSHPLGKVTTLHVEQVEHRLRDLDDGMSSTMKIIHTSDWHLGRQFGPASLRSDQEAFADWFVELVQDQGADLVVIAGDLYDRAIAPVEAIDLFRDTMGRLLATGTVVAAISGNHDGPDRVAPYADLLDLSGFYIRGGYKGIGEVIRHEFPDGPLDLVLLPFLDPQAAPDGFGAGQEPVANGADDDETTLVERRQGRTHHSVLETATAAARSACTAPRSLAIAHAYVTGAMTSESERQLVVGGTGEVLASAFNGFSYTALGHLHRPQTAGGDTVRYSGTPLAYSFSEEHEKSVTVIEMDAAGECEISQIPVAVGRKVRTLTGDIADLLDSGDHAGAEHCFVRAIVTDRDTVLDAKARLATRYPHIVEVRLLPNGSELGIDPAPVDVRDLPPIDATRQFWEAAQGSPPDELLDALLVAATTSATDGGPA